MLTRSLAAFALAVLLLSCGDSPTKFGPNPLFRLTVRVEDTGGRPVSGLLVSAWNDTLLSSPYEAALASPSGNSQLGDVNCDGRAYQPDDADLLRIYLVRGDSAVADKLDCILSNGDMVTATSGVTVADYVHVLRRSRNLLSLLPDRLVPISLSYQLDDSTGRLTMDPGAAWLYVTHEGPECYWGPEENVDNWYFECGRSGNLRRALGAAEHVVEGISMGYVPGRLLSIEGVTASGIPIVYRRSAFESVVYIADSCPNDSQLAVRTSLQSLRPWSLVVHNILGQKIDSLYFPVRSSRLDTAVWKPEERVPRIYEVTLQAYEAPDITSQSTVFGAIWSDSPEFNLLGTTDNSGSVTSADRLRFLGLWTGVMYGHVGGIGVAIRFSDSLTVLVRDTASGVEKRARYGMASGKNDIALTWP